MPRFRNLQGHEKKIIQWGICSLLLWLVPSVAYAHDLGPILTIGGGIIVLLQLGFWAIILVEKTRIGVKNCCKQCAVCGDLIPLLVDPHLLASATR